MRFYIYNTIWTCIALYLRIITRRKTARKIFLYIYMKYYFMRSFLYHEPRCLFFTRMRRLLQNYYVNARSSVLANIQVEFLCLTE